MRRFVLGIAFLVGLVPVSVGQEPSSQLFSRLTLVLPPGISSETVQISYQMEGRFGGYGGYVRAEENRLSYDIDASFDGKPAENIKLIAYMPGCEIVTLDIQVLGTDQERELPCKPLEQIPLRGQILPLSITQGQPAKVDALYLANWDHKFFGIADGMVTAIRLGTAVPNAAGQFEFSLPNFYKQTGLGDADLQFTLRHAKGNFIASLRPTGNRSLYGGLKIRRSYPSMLRFTAEKQ